MGAKSPLHSPFPFSPRTRGSRFATVLLLPGALPRWGYSRSWGYFPSGGLGLVVVIILVLLGYV